MVDAALTRTVYGALVVDDEAVVSRQLVDGLAISGFRVLGVASSTEALAALAADPSIAAVITDIRMPGLDGLGLAQHILRDRGEDRAIEVVVMTGHATIDDAAAAVRTRVCDFLRKPFRLAEAARAVGLALDRAGARRRSAQERSARLAQLRHLEAVSKEAAATPAIDRDIHAISHALRTPLSAIAGGADLLGNPADSTTEYLTILRNGVRQARQAVELVEELHQAGNPASREPHSTFRLDTLLDHVAQRLRPIAERLDCNLRAATLPPMTVTAILPQIERAIEHCMLEALEWAKAGAALSVSLEQRDSGDASFAVVTVLASPIEATTTDSPPADLAFTETSSLWSRTQEGLRFAIARRLVEPQGGRITSWNGSQGMMALRLAIPV